MDLEIANRTALVYGVSSPIGEAVALRLVDEGCAVLIADESVEAADSLARELLARQGVAREDTASGGVVRTAGGVDGCAELISVAAQWRRGLDLAWLGAVDPGATEAGHALGRTQNLLGLVADHMASRGGGSIVLQSSTAAFWDVPGTSPDYAAMSAGVVQLARQAAVRRASSEVRVNCVCPGGITVGSGVGVLDAPALPLTGPGSVDDVADVAAFLMSPLGAYTTGQAIVIDGGASII